MDMKKLSNVELWELADKLHDKANDNFRNNRDIPKEDNDLYNQLIKELLDRDML